MPLIRDRKGNPKNLCDKGFAELSGELSGAICLQTLVLLDSDLEFFREFFGAVRAIFGFWGSVLALELDASLMCHQVGTPDCKFKTEICTRSK